MVGAVKGVPMRGICAVSSVSNSYLNGAHGITSIAQLKGKNVASQTPAATTSLETEGMLTRNGLSPSEFTLVPFQSPADGYNALRSGSVAAALTLPPTTYVAAAAGYPIIASSRQVNGQVAEGVLGTTLAAINNPTKKKALEQFIRGFAASVKYIEDPANKSAVLSFLASYEHVSPAIAKETLASVHYSGNCQAPLTALGWDIAGPSTAPATVAKTVDLSLAKTALESNG